MMSSKVDRPVDTDGRQKLVVLSGPTASGKTALSVELAHRLNAEIISADSMQVYRGMDIGTAKATEEEKQGVKHYLIDICEPNAKGDDEWNVRRFVEEAQKAIADISARGKLPMVVGGTGFYIHALVYGADFEEEETNSDLRRQLMEKGEDQLWQALQRVDPEEAEEVHPHNKKRVVRALEYYYDTGKKMSELNRRLRQKPPVYRLCYLVLDMPRKQLYERIDSRVDQMMRDGLVEEVKRLKEEGCTRDMVSMQGLGYKEILAYLNGEMSLEEAVYTLKRDTRHFAKRQMTWMRREKEVIFLPSGQVEGQAFPDEKRDSAEGQAAVEGREEPLADRAEKLIREKLGL